MDTNRKILIGTIAAAVVIGGVAIGLILSQTPEKADLSTIHTQAAEETTAQTLPATEEAPKESESTPENAGTSSSVTADLETYTSGKVSIQYPVVSKMEDEEKQNQVNELLKSNALSVIKANEINEETDSLTIKCQVLSVDRKRLSAVYTGTLEADGAAHPASMFYTNTVNLMQVQDMGLSDYSDAYTMAGYVLSDDVEFADVSPEQEAAILEYRSTLDLDSLTKILEDSDFPLSSSDTWPESFSYEKQGTICFSIPVPHALGDYAVVMFKPSTK